MIYIPGDNDIGGEGRDYKTQWKVNRFEENFEKITGLVNVEFVDFIKVMLFVQVMVKVDLIDFI